MVFQSWTDPLFSKAAIEHLGYFEKVSYLLMGIGRETGMQHEYASLFPRSPEMQEFVAEYLVVFVKLCEKVVSFNRKSRLSQFTGSIISSFDDEFLPFKQKMGVWAGLIDHKAKILIAQAQTRSEATAVRTSRALEWLVGSRNNHYRDRLALALAELSPHQRKYDSTWRRQRKKGLSEWIREETLYRQWRISQASHDNPSVQQCLVIHGKLGSGKTVLMANIVGDLYCLDTEPGQTNLSSSASNMQTAVATFFCQHDNEQALDSDTIIRSISHQLLRSSAADPEKLADDLESPGANSSEMASLLKRHLRADCVYFVVIDAIDELHSEDALDLLLFLCAFSFLQPEMRLCVSCRSSAAATTSSLIEKSGLPLAVSISVHSSTTRDGELERFVDQEIERRASTRPMAPELLNLVREALVGGAQGM
jgi:Cdc6-like AAA superfamily ATPase